MMVERVLGSQPGGEKRKSWGSKRRDEQEGFVSPICFLARSRDDTLHESSCGGGGILGIREMERKMIVVNQAGVDKGKGCGSLQEDEIERGREINERDDGRASQLRGSRGEDQTVMSTETVLGIREWRGMDVEGKGWSMK
ncbi:hypothetical protein ACH5RR_019002 [Cinchona calisaya]|uniref:Uncharacterized protein n=1 Tax=Cinchona calisaya TaxID=153742 RepID=A0ABD2ZPD3_9GENT